MTIDWKMIQTGYNLRHSSNLSESEMLEHLYRSTGSMEKVGDYLGVSSSAVVTRMDKLHIPRLKRSGAENWRPVKTDRIIALGG